MAIDIGAIEARLGRLEDMEQIWKLLMEYKSHLDQRDFAAYSRLFTEDGEWFGNLGHARGPAEIEALLAQTLEVYPDDSTRTLHLMANPVIELDGERARAESTWCYVTRDESDRPVLSLIGHYRDVLARDAGRWKFLRREAFLDFPYGTLDTSSRS